MAMTVPTPFNPGNGYTVAPIVARPYDYNKIGLSWTGTPTYNTSYPWTKFLLVRSQLGFPVTADDGDVLISTDYNGYLALMSAGTYDSTVTASSYSAGGGYASIVLSTSIPATMSVGQVVNIANVDSNINGTRAIYSVNTATNTITVVLGGAYTKTSTATTGTVTSYSAFTYTDSGSSVTNPSLVLKSNKVYYYSAFVYVAGYASLGYIKSWVRAGNAMATSVKNYGTQDLMYDYVPHPFKQLDVTDATSVSTQRNDHLYRFLKIFAFEYDYLKSMTDNFKNKFDLDNVSGKLLPAMLTQFGMSYDSNLGLAWARRMLKTASTVYNSKGSTAGIRTFVQAFTGYKCTVGGVKNLFLTSNDSSFESSIGNWSASTGSPNSVAISAVASDGSVVPYDASAGSPYINNSQKGLLKVAVSIVSGTASVGLNCGVTSPVLNAIPVTTGLAYTFSVYSRASATARTITLGIDWYNSAGVYLSSSATGSATNSTSSWTQITVANKTAPANAVYAVPTMSIGGVAASENHYFDAAQFEQGASATVYADSRRVDLYLLPDRINLLLNPGFEGGVTTNWSATNASLAVQSTTPVKDGSKSLKITSGGSTITVTSSAAVTAGTYYTFSMWVRTAAVARVVTPSITWSGGGSSTGSAVTMSSSQWQQVSVTGQATAGSTTATVTLTIASPGTLEVYYADSALFEAAPNVANFFDGYNGYNEITDMLWTGPVYYYLNFKNVMTRLPLELPKYLTAGTNYAVLAGQVGDPTFNTHFEGVA